ncbi:hypothetical protein EDI_085630 [Entamoeba dispar SAW760]|uniref:Uncharacterized protein n=1 Tax=Entamoeba dispar (strain ATCC PRA-260 / SAW760) TaxID=370354 RepID=B0EF13_ENTDS|nr:uncharacterized protein EDI_085630 [Entamoeba dispar SAW760]EDR26862.1 hypothetical protein EDI_085630 [Entamoeba dispar SAW760]|eukprot:EDR26862.1 hypothetical protein EDI_085630 [Entamoeba dispar SAW760]
MSARHTKDFDWDTLRGNQNESHYLGGTTKCHQSWFQKYLDKEQERLINKQHTEKEEQKALYYTLYQKPFLNKEKEINLKSECIQTLPSSKEMKDFLKLNEKEKLEKKPKKENSKNLENRKKDGVVSKKLHFKK